MPDPRFDGVDGARAAVRRMVRAGADWIKIGADGTLGALRKGRGVRPTDDELSAIVDEAARCGRDAFAHAHTSAAVVASARAGVRSVEHGVSLDGEAMTALRENGCWYVPTMAGVHAEGDASTDEAHRRSVRLALDAGVDVAAGSDMSSRPRVNLLDELSLLSRAGLGDLGALRAATSDAARLHRLEHDHGRVAPGLRADLVLLDGPAFSTADLPSRIRRVWRNGHNVTTAG